ncbi:MAG: gamma carbonic anhydrase family protein [Proteobacteria bacterium]|nr:gamma carbonic anhydrase family protein [Pseudomonadota bacterium]
MTPSRFTLDGISPNIHPEAWVAPGAVLIGAVTLAAHANIWFNCTLRADNNTITIGERTNIQDGTIIHVNAGAAFAARIGSDVTVGHAAIIHACTLHDRAFVGMGAIVLDGAIIEPGGMLAAHSTLTPGKRIGPDELWMGSPARLVRVMDAAEQALRAATAPHYVALAARYRRGLQPS